ncbi:MAG: metal-dependent transcriptional regulator [Ignavibacteriae bacterium]|nr:metal-dependent transcriptional regulator [Ignavibacteriota bacterium]
MAEEIGMNELEWHDQAEMIEHSLTPEEADALSAKMGNPKFDPHGDPIPSTDGIMPVKKGVSLNEVEEGETLRILHIEDEPKSIYTKLVSVNLFPGRVIKVILKTVKKIKLSADGEEITITPLLASNINVEHVAKSEFIEEKQRDLLSLKKGEIGVVARILPVCRGQQRRRLLDFGIVPGSEISVLMKSPMNDPVAYIVKDTIVALRKDQAKQVILKNVS